MAQGSMRTGQAEAGRAPRMRTLAAEQKAQHMQAIAAVTAAGFIVVAVSEASWLEKGRAEEAGQVWETGRIGDTQKTGNGATPNRRG